MVLELGRKKIDFCAVQELRSKGQGKSSFNLFDHKKHCIYSYYLLYSGTPTGGRHGVGIFIKSSKIHFLKGWGYSHILWDIFLVQCEKPGSRNGSHSSLDLYLVKTCV